MTALAENAAEASGNRLADLSPCPKCGELLIGPKSSSYLGLGRISHDWHCDGCGASFRTSARLAGIVDADALGNEPAPAI